MERIFDHIQKRDYDIHCRALRLLNWLIPDSPVVISSRWRVFRSGREDYCEATVSSICRRISSRYIDILIDAIRDNFAQSYEALYILRRLSARKLLSAKKVYAIIKTVATCPFADCVAQEIMHFGKTLEPKTVEKIEQMFVKEAPHVQEIFLYALSGSASRCSDKILKQVLIHLQSDRINSQIAAIKFLQSAPEIAPRPHINVIINMLVTNDKDLLKAVLSALSDLAYKMTAQQIGRVIELVSGNETFLEIAVRMYAREGYRIQSSYIPLPSRVRRAHVDRLFRLLRGADEVTGKTALVLIHKIVNSLERRYIDELVVLLLRFQTPAESKILLLKILQDCRNLADEQILVLIEKLKHNNELVSEPMFRFLVHGESSFKALHAVAMLDMLDGCTPDKRAFMVAILLEFPEMIPPDQLLKVLKLTRELTRNYKKRWPETESWFSTKPIRHVRCNTLIPSLTPQQVEYVIELFNMPWSSSFYYARRVISQIGHALSQDHVKHIIEITVKNMKKFGGLPIMFLSRVTLAQNLDSLIQLLDPSKVTPHLITFRILTTVAKELKPKHVRRIISLLEADDELIKEPGYNLIEEIYKCGNLHM
jgi:hypothetical protein